MRTSLEDLLREEAFLDEATLRKVRRFARHNGVCLARAAVEEGGVSDVRLAETVARRLGLQQLSLADEPIDDDAVRAVPFQLADCRRLLPLQLDQQRHVIRVAMADPLDIDATEEIEMSTGFTIEPVVATVGDLAWAVQRYYRGVVTKMIPRGEESDRSSETSAPSNAGTQQMVAALVDVLIDRGLVERDAFEKALERRAHPNPGSGENE